MWYFYSIFLLYLQFNISVISVNIMYHYLSILYCYLFNYLFIFLFIFLCMFLLFYVYLLPYVRFIDFVYVFFQFFFLFILFYLLIFPFFIFFFFYFNSFIYFIYLFSCSYTYYLDLSQNFIVMKLAFSTWICFLEFICVNLCWK